MKKLQNILKSPTARLLATVLLAFIAALCFRRSAGIVAMLPIAFALCAVAAFIKTVSWEKVLIFGVTVFALNTVESEMSVALIFAALAAFTVFLLELSVRLFKNNKGRGISALAVSAIICMSLSFCIIGNPFTAYSAKAQIDAHIESTYPQIEGASLGEFEFSSIYLDLASGCYAVDATSSKYPTETGRIRVTDGLLKDGFYSVMEQKISESYTYKFTELLRNSFTSDSFSVKFERIATRDGDIPLASRDGELASKMIYEITIGGIQTAKDMIAASEQYLRIIDDSGAEYSEIIFKSGVGSWYRRCIRVLKNQPKFGTARLVRVHAGLSDRVNRYVELIIGDPFR